jgi:NlpE N-terminal domain
VRYQIVFRESIAASLLLGLSGVLPLALSAVATPISQVPVEPVAEPIAEPVAPTNTLSSTYGATLPAASSPGREITLMLNPGGLAEMTTDYLNGESPVVEAGIWRTSGGSVVRVTFDERNGEPMETTSDIIFRVINGNLVAVVYDRTVYGSAGLVLEPR